MVELNVLLLLIVVISVGVSHSFVLIPSYSKAGYKKDGLSAGINGVVTQRSNLSSKTTLYASNTANAKTTLTQETKWNLRLVLRGITTAKGKKSDLQVFTTSVQFLEEEGYEPPQGRLEQVATASELIEEENSEIVRRLKITKSYWKLSEDPSERKDGLWVWGLFKEPLYPFLLLQMETEKIPLPSSSDGKEGDEGNDYIPPLQLYAQINHQREKEIGVILAGGNQQGTVDLKVRQMESMKADPFGAATVDIYEEVDVGSLSISPAAAEK